MVDEIGRYESIKKHLIDLIDNAISGSPHFGHVSGEWWDLPRNFAQNLPLVTVRLGPTTVGEQVYGMVLQSSVSDTDYGRMEEYAFALYCFASGCKETGESTDRYVHLLVDDIKDYLEERRFNQGGKQIHDITDITDRESNVEAQPKNIRRMIVEGTLWVKKEQDIYYNDAFEYIFLSE